MKKLIRSFVAAAFLAVGVVTVTQVAPASAAAYSYCGSGLKWYVHAPYVLSGNMAAWATCVPNSNPTAPWPDLEISGSIGIKTVVLTRTATPYCVGCGGSQVGINYETGRIIGSYGDTVIAAASCPGNGYNWWTMVQVSSPAGSYQIAGYPRNCS